MKLIFFIKSETVDISNYTIKDIPGSSGRLDVISRCVLAALLGEESFEKNIQMWVFLDNYGTYIFNPELLNYNIFPRNELLLTDNFVDFLKKLSINGELTNNPLDTIKVSKISIIDAIKHFQNLKYNLYILNEGGKDFFKLLNSIQQKKNIIFIIGSQEGEFINSKELLSLRLPTISLGTQSYLASSVIRLLKLHFLIL